MHLDVAANVLTITSSATMIDVHKTEGSSWKSLFSMGVNFFSGKS